MTRERDLNRDLTPHPDLSVELLDDNDLLRLTRQGSDEAYAALYNRYVYPARRLARHLGGREESDDVVADAFAQILDLLKRGKGPDRAFRAYLFTTIRHESGRRAKASGRVVVTDDQAQIDTAVPFGDGQLDDFERTAIRAAYESLPPRWRTVLWHLDVEGHRPAELADVLGVKANSVSALVYRARSGLRDAYLQQHVRVAGEPLAGGCASARDKLSSVIRRTASSREQAKVHAHLNTCSDCVDVYASLEEVNREIGTILTPAALAGAIGGGVALVGVSSGGAIVAQLLTAAKGLAVAAVPAAAVTATTVVIVDVVRSPTPSTQPVPVARTSPPAKAAAPAVPGRAAADAAATPKVAKVGQGPNAAPAIPVAPVDPAPSDNVQPQSTVPAPATPSDPAPAPAVPSPTKPVDVKADRDSINVKLGPVEVSTDDVADTVEKLLKLPKDLLSGLTPTPAP